jgi:poly-gamma-glutamate synthesis protein (capsule biosynthesis protein)
VDKGFSSVDECFSPALLARMRAADLLVVNCESTVSNRGSALEGKAYTFRTSAKTAQWFSEIGADLIGLANNHTYDFGKTAFLDTLDIFDGLNLPVFGAGVNAEEAYKPYYFEKNGVKIALIAASRAEKLYYTVVAEENEPGIAGCYDTTLVCQSIKEAKKQADYVIVYVHYGYERTTVIEEAQQQASYDFIDAGADAVIGHHAHILQGIEQYKGKPIFYSLGNYLFNRNDQTTALLELTFESPDKPVFRIIPARQKDCRVIDKLNTDEGQETLRFLQDLSPGIAIDRSGIVYLTEVYPS